SLHRPKVDIYVNSVFRDLTIQGRCSGIIGDFGSEFRQLFFGQGLKTSEINSTDLGGSIAWSPSSKRFDSLLNRFFKRLCKLTSLGRGKIFNAFASLTRQYTFTISAR